MTSTPSTCASRALPSGSYEGAPRFVADAGRATLYNPRQAFVREKISPDGDQTDWIAIDESLVRDVVASFSSSDADAARPFRFTMASVGQAEYLAQRALFNDVAGGLDDCLEIEERALGAVSSVLASAYAARPKRSANSVRSAKLAECAREVIMSALYENLGVRDIAARLGVSAFHLCRVFRASAGMTLHAYRRDMRLRAALGLVSGHRGQLSSLALQVGFYSHSHFTEAFRRAFGVSPAAII